MKPERSYRGWLAALTVAITLTLTLMTVEKHLKQPTQDRWDLAEHAAEASGDWKTDGIVLQANDQLLAANAFVPNNQAQIRRRDANSDENIAGLLRRPPEPAANAVLLEPLTAEDFVSLPLTFSSSGTDLLMQSMEDALQSPLKMVSTVSAPKLESTQSDSQRLDSLRSPSETAGKIPEPTQLQIELRQLQSYLDPHRFSSSAYSGSSDQSFPSRPHYVAASSKHAEQIEAVLHWAAQAQSRVDSLVSQKGLEHEGSRPILAELTLLSEQGRVIGEQLEDYELAQQIIRTGYSLQRRVEVWNAIEACLDETSIRLSKPQSAQIARRQITEAITEIEAMLKHTDDREGWRKYLLLDDLASWAGSGHDDWQSGNHLSTNYLSRVNWVRLDHQQRKLVEHKSVAKLTACLATWARTPIDYRQLLTGIESVEQESHTRQDQAIAQAIHILRHPDNPAQQRLSDALNTHYRNANLRLTVSKELMERFLPQGKYEVRPVRQRILGANTSGDSEIRTQLAVKLKPDPNAWNIELEVQGDLVSNTQSSKGPAVFHNTSTAQVSSRRYLRMGPTGYNISSEQPANVTSQDYLQKMSTDFDGLPVIGDFARFIVREQFNQKKGVAKRITQRKIAQEVDQAFDRQLEESLKAAELDLQKRLLGPLERLTLEPLVVSMSTTVDRLSIRYRLSGEDQLTSHTPRPRAPGDCLTSFQVHQSVINNTIDKTQLSGRTWSLAEIYERLGEVFQTKLTPPEDVPDDISVRFADRAPVSIDMVDGQLRLNLRFAEFKREGMHIRNFIVTSSYVPYADGLNAGLVRDPNGSIEIQGKHLPMRDRLALRVIFAKVFVSKPQMSLVSPQWAADPRAEGLAVSQLDLRDGWFAVAISRADNPLAVEVAERTRALQSVNY